jgi:hypothetical protein
MEEKPLKLGAPAMMRITANAGKTEFLFHLEFLESHQPIEFVVDTENMMTLMVGLQKLQAKYKIPIPDHLRPAGKPALRIVMPDE